MQQVELCHGHRDADLQQSETGESGGDEFFQAESSSGVAGARRSSTSSVGSRRDDGVQWWITAPVAGGIAVYYWDNLQASECVRGSVSACLLLCVCVSESV